jgi:hypothetical protein
MTPSLDKVLRDLAKQRADHAQECEKKADDYEKAARDMRAAAAADRELIKEITGLSIASVRRPPETKTAERERRSAQ